MYLKLSIWFGSEKERVCSVGPFKDYEQASRWTGSLFKIIYGTEIQAIWEESTAPTGHLYPAATPPDIVLGTERSCPC